MGKQKKNVGEEESPVVDLSCPSSKIYEDISKHRTCWLHNVAYLRGIRKKISKQQAEQLRSFELTSPCFLGTFPSSRRSKVTKMHENAITKETKKLDSTTFESYFQNLWRSLPEDKRISFTYIDCLWFSLYMNISTKEKVLSWIKRKQIFSKKYVIVPIVIWSHWNLLIFCNFDESMQSKTRTPCMLLLDSLENANPRRLEPDIRKFVWDIYKTEGRTEDRKSIYRIPLLVPKVPQQRDGEECGGFVLYYINQFVQGAPENFSIKDFPYFMDRNWFSADIVAHFCGELKALKM
ncbi:Cysteine proteinases superfamily protein putative isoform 1 [Tripterygium wilfordii]|uniref:Cysteine proteinases superfamily protein putative isoform 1 n=1 Tax=Tripterygium wilfordii TaxID=458696 RepID=A0A7J7CAG8_TRIWF|nr:probable ubiquitin-like-specific protease 2A [Tripterygium wilfordii]KAF5730925.1 Cysteine proteinases superfamily protein putative isoform 1 [Tripterygium wilfordii]